MKFGLMYELQMPKPWYEGQEYDTYWQAIAQIELAEEMGFDYFWTVEHHFLSEFSHSSAPEVLYGAISQRTKTIRLGHGVVLLPYPYNHPIRVAERIAVLDIVSNGRVDFGTGRSTTLTEMGGFGIKPEDTRPMWEEALEMIPQMWMKETFSWEGKYFHVPPRTIVPKPIQKPHPPIWMAASQPSSFALAAQKGIGVLCFTVGEPGELVNRIHDYREGIKHANPVGAFINNQVAGFTVVHCQENNQKALEVGGGGAEWFLGIGKTFREQFKNVPEAQKESYRYFALQAQGAEGQYAADVSIEKLVDSATLCIGDPDTCIKVVKKYEEAGLDQLLCFMQAGRIPHQKIMDSIKLFGKYVIPYFKNTRKAVAAK